MCIVVYSGKDLIEQITCTSKEQAEKVAFYWKEEGFQVNIFDVI